MKLIIELANKDLSLLDEVDGIILPLKDYSVESIIYYSMDEIVDITKKYNKDIFVKINKNFMNEEIDDLKNILIELNKYNITGIIFYDLCILQLKKELELDIDLVWGQTHMVNNYKTCDYYYSKGVKYGLLGKEITLEEIIEIINKSNIISMVDVVSRASVAFSRRSLITNYYKNIKEEYKNNLVVREKITRDNYIFIENRDGTSIYLDKITNGTSIIKDLFNNNCNYIIMREYGIDCFRELVIDTMKYINNKCIDDSYINKYKKLGNYTNFFFKKTIYRVK